MNEKLQKLIKLCKEKEEALSRNNELFILILPPSMMKEKIKEIDDYESKREKAKQIVKDMGGMESLTKEHNIIDTELAEIKPQLAEYIEEYPREELETMVSEDDYEWLATKEGEIRKYLKGIDA